MESAIFNNDFDVQYLLKKQVTLIENFDSEKSYSDINDIVELYIIKKAFELNVLVPEWDNEKYNSLKAISKQFSKSIGIFFSKLNCNSLISFISDIEVTNHCAFWEMYSDLKLYERIQSSEFEHVLENSHIDISSILLQKKLVNNYDEVISEYLSKIPTTAELLITQFYSEYSNKRTLYFPTALSVKDRERIIISYINSEFPNANYLHLISYSQSCKELPLLDKTKLLAKKRYEELLVELSDRGFSVVYGVQTEVKPLQSDDLFREEKKDKKIIYTLNLKWIEDNLDYPTLLNNLIYQLKIVDNDLQSNAVSIKSKLGVFEKHLGLKGNKDYLIGTAFNIERMRIESCIAAYNDILINNRIHIEELYKWFFENYLKKEFGVENYYYSASSSNSNYIEKIRNIVVEIDGVLKQFRMIVEDGRIDRELFEISSEHIFFDSLKSMIEKKYAYSRSDELNKEMQYLFSRQSMLTRVKSKDTKYHCFFELLHSEEVFLSDFYPFQLTNINWLISRGVIQEDENGVLILNHIRSIVLYRLFSREVICCKYSSILMPTIEHLVQEGEMVFESTLFTRAEMDYLNYMLNKSEFSNGLDLRNKYSHGTNTIDEKIQKSDYLILLSIMALIVIKINEEFCLKDEPREILPGV